MLPVEQPYKVYTGLDGKPLDQGYVYFGQPALNPLNPAQQITVYWDAAGTQPAAQPLRTVNGYIVRAGTPANVFVDVAYSELVLDKQQRQVFYASTSAEFSIASVVISFITSLASTLGSSLIGFLQAGAGAVLMTLQAAVRERAVTPAQFGAVGDGVADDTAAFTRAIATGRKVFVPKGTYLCGPLTLANQGQQISGEGAASVLLQKTAGQNLFNVTADYVTIRDLRLNGVETSSANSTFAISTDLSDPASYLTVENVLISGTSAGVGFANAIKFDDGCDYGTVRDCAIERLWGNTSGHGYGILAGNVAGCRALGNNLIATAGRGRHGVYFSAGCHDSVASGNFIKGFDQEGISQYSTGAQPACARNIYSHNTLVGCSASNNAASGSIGIYQHSFGCVITNNTITSSGQKGITVDGSSVTDCANTLVTGNTVSFSGTNGISLTATTRTSVVGNIVHESSANAAGASANIMIRTDGTTACVDTLIADNICSGNSFARCALGVDPGPPAPSLLKLEGNDFRPGTAFTLELNGVSGIQIDGRLQFRFDGVGYGPIANGAAYTGPLVLTGADQGDTCTVDHTQNTDGCVAAVQIAATNTGVLTIANLSGGAKTIAAGTLRVDVWKHNPPL
jgi:hypothetical protein